MKLVERQQRPQPRRLGILAGSFNPPTRAHVALAHSALAVVDEVVFVLPIAFPHKEYGGASFEDRVEMLRRIADGEPRFSAAVSEGGLFIEIAKEAREHYPEAELLILCGRDAAERIVGWDYGDPGAVERMLGVFHLLVAPRQGVYVPPTNLAHAIHVLPLGDFDECSATRVREAITGGGKWRQLVPEEIADIVEAVYVH